MSSVALAYVLTAVISITISLVLVRLATLSSVAKVKTVNGDAGKNTRADSRSISGGDFAHTIKHVIYNEIEGMTGSKQREDKISERISSVFNEELKKRVESKSDELHKRYESVIKEKMQNEEIAWKKYNKALAEKKETETVIRSIAEGLIVVDAKGKVVMMNPAAERLLGVSRDDKVGKSMLENIKDEQLVSLAGGARSGSDNDKEIEIVARQDDTKKVLRASSAVIENENGQTVGMVSVLSDITKQKELDRLKSNFVASVTHELRTPLIAAEKSISLMLEKTMGDISEKQEQFLSLAQRNLKRLSALINDLLDLSKLEAGKFELKRRPSRIEEIVDAAAQTLQPWANTKLITIDRNICNEIPEISMDPDRITQVLYNLVGNSIKFTPNKGRIIIEVVLNKEKEELEVSIMDNGIGISKEHLPRIFDKFYQASERASTDINGTGIGLAVVKEIVELHNGRIWVESEKGQGTKFIFTIPEKSA
ncbi:MAG: PAS domain S-box protein [Candidatus Omnitrophica bacterium]|nr:PAS domain S-box protein [Candidatus Omnitrophota bacterium]